MTHPTKLSAEAVARIECNVNETLPPFKAPLVGLFQQHCRDLLADREVLVAQLERGALCEECDGWEYNEDGTCRTFTVCGACWNPVAKELFEKRQQVTRLEAELQEMQDLVTFYQGEGEAQVPEEDEYRKLASISPSERTEEQSERLRFLATEVVRLCDPKSLRAELQEAREQRDRETELRREVEAKLRWAEETYSELYKGYDEARRETNEIANRPGIVKSYELGAETLVQAVDMAVDRWYNRGRQENLNNFRSQLVAAVRARMPLFNGAGGEVIKLIESFEADR